jgi:hypothetical protein
LPIKAGITAGFANGFAGVRHDSSPSHVQTELFNSSADSSVRTRSGSSLGN